MKKIKPKIRKRVIWFNWVAFQYLCPVPKNKIVEMYLLYWYKNYKVINTDIKQNGEYFEGTVVLEKLQNNKSYYGK